MKLPITVHVSFAVLLEALTPTKHYDLELLESESEEALVIGLRLTWRSGTCTDYNIAQRSCEWSWQNNRIVTPTHAAP